jgi:hypothetical protein
MNCPAPTQDPKLNNRNRLRAIREAMYGPVKGTLFGRCGNCAAFDTSRQMVACGGASPDGEVGYCHAWNFTCAARRCCLSWSPER